jgi:DNA-binding transcriptional LysR family regulator
MDIRAVDLNLLKAFDALHAERAVTRAASRIGLSQPAMSHALSRLRDLFSDDLFVRTQSGMEPTARAREIAPLISHAIEQIEAALNLGAGFDPATSAATFTAGMGEYAEVALVGRLAEAFSRQAPHATLRLVSLHGADAAEQLERGTVDVAVAHLRNLPPTIETALRLSSSPAKATRSPPRTPQRAPTGRSPSRLMRAKTMCWSAHAATPPARSTGSWSIMASAAASRCSWRPISPSPPRSPAQT